MPVTLLSCSNYADDLTQSYDFLMVEATLKALLKHGFTIHAPRRQGTSEVISDVNVTAAVAAAAAPRISNKKLEECIAAVKAKSRSAEHSARRGSVCLPKNGWQLTEGRTHVGFLSHFKREAASDARHLKDQLQDILGAPMWLDSDNITDLNTVLEAVRSCEVLLLLQTKSVLSRPWCVLSRLCSLCNVVDNPFFSFPLLFPGVY